MKINININKNLSQQLKLALVKGSLLFTGLSLVGCSNEKMNPDNESNTNNLETTEATAMDAVASDNQVYYDEINLLETDIVGFCENSLPNGFIEVNESNNKEMAELFTNSYIQLNRGTLEPKTFAVLDQNMELVPSKISKDFMEFSTCIGRYYQVVTPETKLQFDKLIKDTNDLEFITKLSDLIAEMNVCTDAQSRQEKINEIVKIKESLLTNPNIAIDYNSETLYLATKMIIYADATAKAYGQEIITSEEEEIQLYSSYYNVYCDMAVSSGYIEDTEVIDREITSQTSFESKYLSTSATLMESVINKVSNYSENFDNIYAYGKVNERISEKITNLYVEPKQTYIEQENEIREQTSNAIDQQTIGTTTEKEVSEDQVPEAERETTEESVDNTEEPVKNQQDYWQGLSDGNAAGWQAADYEIVSTKSIPNLKTFEESPSPGSNYSTDYINGYKQGYSEGWNGCVANAKASQSAPTTEFVPVENVEESIVSETTPEDVPYNGPEFIVPEGGITTIPSEDDNFIPVNGEETILEESEPVTISMLNKCRMIIKMYGDTQEYVLKDEKGKRM